MKELLNAFAVCHNTCFRQTRQVINLLKLATSNKNNENNNNSYYYKSNKVTIMRCRIEVILMSTHNTPFLNIRKKIILNYPKSATMEFVPRDPRTSSKQPW